MSHNRCNSYPVHCTGLSDITTLCCGIANLSYPSAIGRDIAREGDRTAAKNQLASLWLSVYHVKAHSLTEGASMSSCAPTLDELQHTARAILDEAIVAARIDGLGRDKIAHLIGQSPHYVRSRLADPSVVSAIEDHTRERAAEALHFLSSSHMDALKTVKDIVRDGKKDSDRMRAALILDVLLDKAIARDARLTARSSANGMNRVFRTEVAPELDLQAFVDRMNASAQTGENLVNLANPATTPVQTGENLVNLANPATTPAAPTVQNLANPAIVAVPKLKCQSKVDKYRKSNPTLAAYLDRKKRISAGIRDPQIATTAG